VDRRQLLLSFVASLAPVRLAAQTAQDVVTVRFGASGPEIRSTLFGSNELGTMDGRGPSVDYDADAGITFRRLGGNWTTGYNWTNNATNAGSDWEHQNSFFMNDLLGLSAAQRLEPAAAIEAMHRNSLKVGAQSVVTLPLAGFVAADGDGPVSAEQVAPSARFVPVDWETIRDAGDPIDFSQPNMSQLLRLLKSKFGPAGSAGGIRGYILDNEPGLWSETHPRIVPKPLRVAELLQRSIKAAKVIKMVDPDALVFGPASWGVTEFQTFQNAPDWNDFKLYENFIAAYLDAFRQASQEAGLRLLDVLDVHWYPQSDLGGLLHAEDDRYAEALLAAPRTLSESGFREKSWVTDALPVSDADMLSLPILPSLNRLIERWYPGTELSILEYNFGGRNAVFAGLAVADALGCMAESNVRYAAHWGNVDGWIAEAFRLYRDHDGKGGQFAGRCVQASCDRPDIVAVHAASDGARMKVIAINKSLDAVDLRLPSAGRVVAVDGFDRQNRRCGPVSSTGGDVLVLPPRSVRLLTIA
jgi:mannan endo-1,4-beta-mannosidase